MASAFVPPSLSPSPAGPGAKASILDACSPAPGGGGAAASAHNDSDSVDTAATDQGPAGQHRGAGKVPALNLRGMGANKRDQGDKGAAATAQREGSPGAPMRTPPSGMGGASRIPISPVPGGTDGSGGPRTKGSAERMPKARRASVCASYTAHGATTPPEPRDTPGVRDSGPRFAFGRAIVTASPAGKKPAGAAAAARASTDAPLSRAASAARTVSESPEQAKTAGGPPSRGTATPTRAASTGKVRPASGGVSGAAVSTIAGMSAVAAAPGAQPPRSVSVDKVRHGSVEKARTRDAHAPPGPANWTSNPAAATGGGSGGTRVGPRAAAAEAAAEQRAAARRRGTGVSPARRAGAPAAAAAAPGGANGGGGGASILSAIPERTNLSGGSCIASAAAATAAAAAAAARPTPPPAAATKPASPRVLLVARGRGSSAMSSSATTAARRRPSASPAPSPAGRAPPPPPAAATPPAPAAAPAPAKRTPSLSLNLGAVTGASRQPRASGEPRAAAPAAAAAARAVPVGSDDASLDGDADDTVGGPCERSPCTQAVPKLNLTPVLQQRDDESGTAPAYKVAERPSTGDSKAASQSQPAPEPVDHFYYYPKLDAKEEKSTLQMIEAMPRNMRTEAAHMKRIFESMVEARQNCEAIAFRGHRLLDQLNSHMQEKVTMERDEKQELQQQLQEYQRKSHEQESQLSSLKMIVQGLQGLQASGGTDSVGSLLSAFGLSASALTMIGGEPGGGDGAGGSSSGMGSGGSTSQAEAAFLRDISTLTCEMTSVRESVNQMSSRLGGGAPAWVPGPEDALPPGFDRSSARAGLDSSGTWASSGGDDGAGAIGRGIGLLGLLGPQVPLQQLAQQQQAQQQAAQQAQAAQQQQAQQAAQQQQAQQAAQQGGQQAQPGAPRVALPALNMGSLKISGSHAGVAPLDVARAHDQMADGRDQAEGGW
ncbi:hypothetical protein FOA52_011523 [Chlamydomonas sp. UWO 241]|nr:hypothetical protein FOA52_011523 [Chlamydomonas sp. UWO 241]